MSEFDMPAVRQKDIDEAKLMQADTIQIETRPANKSNNVMSSP